MIPNFEPDDVFEPSHYAGVRRVWDTAETLPGRCYTSQRFYHRERERIFFRYWNCIGHQSRVTEPRCYLAFDFMGVPLIVMRGADREIRAFVNSCPHRGSQIIEDGEGTWTRLQCPYHNWTFALSSVSLGFAPCIYKDWHVGRQRYLQARWVHLIVGQDSDASDPCVQIRQ
jgi:choline monooxygenase